MNTEQTDQKIMTLDLCRAFIIENLDIDDYEVLSGLCSFPTSTIKKYIKEGVPNTSAARVLANRIVVHSFDIIKRKAAAQLKSLDNLMKGFEMPDLAA